MGERRGDAREAFPVRSNIFYRRGEGGDVHSVGQEKESRQGCD